MIGVHTPQVSVGDFIWGVVIIGSIVQPIVRWVIRRIFFWFIKKSRRAFAIWHIYKRAHAHKVIREADRVLREFEG